MTFGRFVGIVVVIGAVGAAAIAWPGPIVRFWPAWGPRAMELRAGLPARVVEILPPYTAESEQVAASNGGAPRTGAPGAGAGAGGGRPQAANGGGGEGGARPNPNAARSGAPGGGQPARPPTSVTVDTVQRGPMAVRLDAIGSVQPIASVALKTRVDATIDQILVPDGAAVKQGDVLVKFDSRQIEAQIAQAQAVLAKDQATVDQASRDVTRYTDLFAKGSGTQTNLDTSRTTLTTGQAAVTGDKAQLDNLNVQLGWFTITAPISGRVGTFSMKAGNIIRTGDNSATGTLATIVQMDPIYVAFSVPQAQLTELRDSMAAGTAVAEATPQGGKKAAQGKVAVLDNTIDQTTGTLMVRASFQNDDETLWPGQLCNVRVTFRVDPQTVSIPRSATQYGQTGNFVFVVDNNVAHLKPVQVGRTQDGRDVVISGLQGGETVVTEGANLLVDGARVEIRGGDVKKGAS